MKNAGTGPSARLPAGARARPPAGCAIVGIGASAGGLEAFTELLKHLPANTGFGFVLVQHLDPQHESALTQLLARATAMPVREVTQNLRVRPNHVYVIPPNTNLGITRGTLKLQPRVRDRAGLRTIDSFLETLARDQRERAIGVILSGNATDGTLGLEAVKAAGGLTFAQDDSARHDSMPRSAVAAGCVDFVLSPRNIARELAAIAHHPYVAGRHPPSPPAAGRGKAGSARGTPLPGANGTNGGRPPPGDPDDYHRVLALLRNHSGVDFTLYKASTIHRRIIRRMVLNQRDSLGHYAGFLRGNVKELDALYADILISVTSFFRNADAFDLLKRKVFPRLLQRHGDEPVRIWVLGCATGQEAYSLAIAFTEAAEKAGRPPQFQIFATDLSEANLDKARHGLYAKALVQDVSPDRLQRFFLEEDGGYRVIKSLREQVVFARQNIISDPPFSRMDLISCRNLMIYLEPSLQKKALPAFHYALKPDGFLFLGASESIGGFGDLFAPVDKTQKIFARKAAPATAFQLPVPHHRAARPAPGARAHAVRKRDGAVDALRGELNAEREADRVTVNHFAPPGVLIDGDLRILQFRGSTDAYLEPPTGKARFDLLKMAREGLMLPLRTAINRAARENEVVRKANIPVTQQGRVRFVDVEIVPLKNLSERRFLVLFADGRKPDVPPAAAAGAGAPARFANRKEASGRAAGLERDLAETRDYLHSIQESQEATNEELQTANEEGQSANEELQSLNEELETSKEELESTNEELITVNEEVASRNQELNRLNNDLVNLQSSTDLAIVLLGRDLAVRRFSTQAEKQFNLLATDVGRPIGEIRHNLDLTDLETVIAAVISSGRECEREVRDKAGHWYSLRVRPYVGLDRRVDGAVVVLMDIDDLKTTERFISEQQEHAEAIIRTVPNPLVILGSDLRVRSTNQAFNRAFKVVPAAVKGRSFFELDRGAWNIPGLRALLKGIIPQNSFFSDFELTRTFARIGRRSLLLNARTLNESGGRPPKLLLGIQDVTARRQAEAALRKVEAQLAVHAEHLEVTVTRRTAELTAANRQLKVSIRSVRRGKEEYRALFAASQAMQKKLRHLARQIITAQEEERKEISRELHDEVVQMLVGINVELSALRKGNSIGVHNLRDKISHAQRLVENSVHSVHRFARGLRPAVLDDLGLIPALHAFSENLAARKKIKIKMTAYGGVEALGGPKRTALFRVAQEALTNVGRHAHATEVRLTIRKMPGSIRMEISDNGRAFPVRKTLLARNNKRLGLVGMRERMEMVGGSLTIESAAGKGTTVRADIPFHK